MRGPKLNEGATQAQYKAGERHGTKATAKHVRTSAYKARVVLDLIRGLPVRRADEVLQFTERGAAHDVRKVLASAVANATDTNNGAYVADADELFVLACFADEGATLRRFRPRARGRATRIRKRTCHITVVVARMSDERLAVVQARAEGQVASSAASRRARVERSRKRAEAAKAGTLATDETVDETVEETPAELLEAVEETKRETPDADGLAALAEPIAEEESDETVDEAAEAADDEATGAAFAPGEWPGSMLPDADGNGPETHPIKGNADSMLYHGPDSRYYKITKAEVWFDTPENAEAAGFSKPGAASDEETN
jgi:large subunit ribosomal protein L22